MPLSELSHFDERSGIVASPTPWGKWWQTVDEVHIEVNLPDGCLSKEVNVQVNPRSISCVVKGQVVFKGPLFGITMADDMVWTVEDRKLLRIVLTKADHDKNETLWTSLLCDEYEVNPYTLHQMRQKLDLEKFQIENPGFDFSGAKLSKCYDNMPLPQNSHQDTSDSST